MRVTDDQTAIAQILPRYETPVVIHDSPFKARSEIMLAPEGSSLWDMVVAAGFVGKRILKHVHVYIDDHEIPRDRWHVVRPKQGASVYIQVRLHGGGGDGEDKNPLRTILLLAVVVLAAWVAGPGAIFGAKGAIFNLGSSFLNFAANMAVSAAVATAGFFLVDAIVPPPRPPGAQYGWGQQDGNPYAMLTGIRNQFAPYSPVPRVLGKRRMFPLLAARPYTENLNGKQYLRMLLLVGYGRLRITDLRIGDSPITAFPGASYEIREGTSTDAPVTLFTRVVREDSLTIRLQRTEDTASGGSPPNGWNPGFDFWWTYDPAAPDVPRTQPVQVDPTTYVFSDPGGWITRTTRNNTSEISLDISAPRGMYRANAQGRRYETYVDVQVQYRAAGTSGSWLTPTWLEPNGSLGTGTNGTIRVQALSADPIVRSARFSTGSSGQWDVRVKHNGPTRGSDPTYVDDVYWSSLRSISTDTPVTMPGVALIALRLEASDQLNGAPDTINCLAESYLPTYTGSAWDDVNTVISSNPAWCYAHVMRYRGQNRVIPDERIDGPCLKAWADACAATAPNASEPRWTYDNVIEGGSIYQVLTDIAGHGRASFTIVDGKYSVVRDVEQTVPVQIITPRNSWGYEGRKAFVDIPHAFRCTFSNKDKNNEPDEVIVYRDGYAKEAATGVLAATKFELLNFPAATSSTQAWREGRYHLATLLLRPEEHTVSMDVEHIRCTKGDFVRLQYDVIKIGLGSGRISGRTVASGNVTHLDLDSPVTMENGKSYSLRVRKRNGSVVLLPLVTVAGFQETVQLVTPVAEASAPNAGDLFAFGEAGIETAPMIVKSIEAGEDLSARLTLVDAQAGVWTADTGTIPAFSTFISGRRHVQDAPAIPSLSLTSSEAALLRLADGTLQERLAVRIVPRGNDQIAVSRFEVQFRQAGGGDWTPVGDATPEAPLIYITNVTQGEAYDVRVRAWSAGGTPSAWASATNHTIVGKTTRPADVTGLAVTRRIDGVVLTFVAVADIDLWAYEVRRGGTGWADAAHVGYFTATTISLQETLSADTAYRVKAIDVIGLESVNAASVTASATLPVFPGNAAGVPTGVQALVNADFNQGASGVLGWDSYLVTDSGLTVTAGRNLVGYFGQPMNVLYSLVTGTPAVNAIWYGWKSASDSLADLLRFGLPVAAGDRVYAGALMARYRCTAAESLVFWYGPTGSFVSASVAGSGGTLDGAVNGSVANFAQVGGFVTAPSGAAFAVFAPRGVSNGSGATPYIFWARPMLARVAADQTAPPPYSGSRGDPLADVTGSNTAADFAGRGWGATATEDQASNARVPAGQNGLVNADLSRGAYGWEANGLFGTGSGGFTLTQGVNAAGFFGARNVFFGTIPGTPPSTVNMNSYISARGSLAILRQFGLPVVAGQRIFARARVAFHRFTGSAVRVAYYNAAGAYLFEEQIASGGRLNGGADGNPDNFDVVGGFATVPANAAFAAMWVNATGAAGTNPALYWCEPMLGVALPGQTVLPEWQPGRADPVADQTASNTAADFTGRGALATLNTVGAAQIEAGAVGATQLAAGAVSAVQTQNTAAAASIGTSWGDLASVTIAVGARGVNIDWSAYFAASPGRPPSAGSVGISARIRRDTTTIWEGTVASAEYADTPDVDLRQDGFRSGTVVDQPTAGTYTYTLQAIRSGGGVGNQAENRTIVARSLNA